MSSSGQVTGLQRGPTTERWEYDSQGRIISRVFADGKMWSYTYLDKVQENHTRIDHCGASVRVSHLKNYLYSELQEIFLWL